HDGPEGVEAPERTIAEREEREGEDERVTEAQAVGQRATEEREQVDQRAEQSGHEAGLHVVEPHHAQQVGAKGDERAGGGGAFAQLRGVRGPERAGEAPGGFLGGHFDSVVVGCGRMPGRARAGWSDPGRGRVSRNDRSAPPSYGVGPARRLEMFWAVVLACQKERTAAGPRTGETLVPRWT